ncbi:importin-9 isoform X1 [Micractinium conductrix]|uniref:Importin-9 isoform X1 n=1 Tax=Micractinium conductrix TaxID=554055 RepID=A0A2P6VFS4_9CHLO|nr:importin-9 isoform X1 [Micractinium conductrix]|eukprot:PSC72945.1 importin-9 isoform X1 [Micractinium conductrix]
MHLVQSSLRLALVPQPLRLSARNPAHLACQHAALRGVMAQAGGEVGSTPPAAAVEQAAAAADAAAEQATTAAFAAYDEVAAAVSATAEAAAAAEEEQQARQAVPPPAAPVPRGFNPQQVLQHPAARIAGAVAAVFLGGTFLLTMWRMARDPQRKRSKTVNKNKLVVDTIGKYLPGNRAGLSGATFGLLKMQTGFSSQDVFRKYLWFLLRERQFDEEALGDLVALKAALGLTDEQVAEALAERAQRVYDKYGTVMVNLEGMSQAGIERKAASRNLFIKLLSLSESRGLLAAEAAEKVDLGKIFGVTQRDILTLRSGYSAETDDPAVDASDEDSSSSSQSSRCALMAPLASPEAVAHLLQLLQASLSADAGTRQQAEAALAGAAASPGFGSALVAVLLSAGGEVPFGLRQLAATVLKKLVREHWTAESPHYQGPAVGPEEKEAIREALPRGLGDESSKVRTAVAMAVASIAKWDCPQQWPALIPGLVQAITAKKNVNMVSGSVRCLAMFVDEQGEEQIMAIAPALLPELLSMLQNDEYGPALRRKALAILHTVLETLQELASGPTLAGVKALLSSQLPGWLGEFARLLSRPLTAEDPEEWGVHMECLRCLMLLITGFGRLAAPDIGPALTAAWQMYTNALPLFYELVICSDEGEGAVDEEGDSVDFDDLISQLLELVLSLVGNQRYAGMLRASMQQLLHLALGYMQMTAAQVERWASDPNQYVADEEDDFSTVRAAGEMLLDEMFVAFEGEAAVPFAAAVTACLQEAAAVRAAGRDDWWKLREAALYAVGTVSTSLVELAGSIHGALPLDIDGLMASILQEDLVPTAPPFLIGRALWVTSRLAPAIPPQHRTAYMHAAAAGLAPGSPPPVQIGACRALAQLCQKAKQEELAGVAQQMFGGLCQLLVSSTDEVLHLVLETLTAAAKAAPDAAAHWEQQMAEPALNAWIANVADPLLSVDARELLEALAAIPACLPNLQARMLPTLCGIIAAPQQHSSILVDGAVELVTLALAPSGPEAAQRIHAAATPAMLQLVMHHDDGEVLRSATAYLRTLLQVGGPAVLSWPAPGLAAGGLLPALLGAVQRLLDPGLEDRAASLSGALILELLRHAGPQMAPLLPGLLRALVERLEGADESAMVQSLLCVLAQLLRADQAQLLDCLAGTKLSNGRSALDAAMQKWCERQIEIRTPYDIKLTTSALAALLTSGHPALDAIQVKGRRLDTEGGIRTRAQARLLAEQWSAVPLRVKIIMLLTDSYIEATTQEAESEEEEWEEVSGSESEEEGEDGGAPGLASSLGGAVRRFAAAFEEGAYDAEDAALSNVDPQEAARRQQDPLSALDIPSAVREAFQRVAAAQPALMQAGSEQLSPTQLAALQRIFGQQPAAA